MRRALLVAVVFASGLSVGWLLPRGDARGGAKAVKPLPPEKVWLHRQDAPSPADGFYRPYSYTVDGSSTRLGELPPEGAETWILTLSPGVVVHMVRAAD